MSVCNSISLGHPSDERGSALLVPPTETNPWPGKEPTSDDAVYLTPAVSALPLSSLNW